MTMNKLGDIVLVSFPFSGGVGFKKRPAVVLLDTSDGDFIAARITSQPSFDQHDLPISDWKYAGLILPSIIRLSKLATLEKSMIDRKMGELHPAELISLKEMLKNLLTDIIK